MSDRTFLDEEYEEKLRELAEKDGYGEAELRELYLEECKRFGEFLHKDTPPNVIRRISLSQIENKLPKKKRF